MRGPLFSGAVGHRSTLERLAALVRQRSPVVVLGTVWLAEALAEATPVLLLVEARRLRAAMRASKRCEKAGRQLTVAIAGPALPLRPAGAGALVLDDLVDLEDDDLLTYVPDLVPFMSEGGLLVTLDRTKEPATESRIAGSFLAGGLLRIGQERPREGALITVGAAPGADVVAALSASAIALGASE
ncbi:MAG: hypothetical protein SF187_00690 [Deltaproteobacteria bacterium]|nr:hypothetical protein [Deltaproteobacteria bacterium]